MMNEMIKRHGIQKRLAIVMALLMVLGLLPDSLLQVRAENNVVIITVKDENGVPVAGASVSYKILLGSAGSVSGDGAGSVSGDGAGSVSGNSIETVSGGSVSAGNRSVPLQEKTGREITDVDGKIAIAISDLSEGMTISLEISKEGFGERNVPEQPLEANMEVSLRKIPGIQPLDHVYNEEEQELVSVSCSDNADDVILYSTDRVNWQEDIPTGKAAGKYSVYVKVEREGYEPFESDKLTATIKPADIQGLTATLCSGLVYNGQEQELLDLDQITGVRDGDKIYFSVSGNEMPFTEWEELTDEKSPRACDAGDYAVRIKVERENYNDTEIEPDPAIVTIQKAEPELKFVKVPATDTVDFDGQKENTYGFSASSNALQPQNITYSVENAAKNDKTDINDIAFIVPCGENAAKLTIKQAGHIIKITATADANQNYTDVSETYVLVIRDTSEDLIGFKDSEVNYTLGTSDLISAQVAEKSHEDDNGEVTYEGRVEGFADKRGLEEIGIELSDSGQVSVTDLERLSNVLEEEEGLSIVITASKGEGTKECGEESRNVYAGGGASYTINISTEEIPANAWTKYNPDDKEILPKDLVNGWHNTKVIVRPADGYAIARDKVTNPYDDSVVYGDEEGNKKGDQGKHETRKIYLKNIETGGITTSIPIDLEKLDNEAPYDLRISFSDSEPAQDGVKYYNGKVTFVFNAKDDTSGVEKFCWSYVSSGDVGSTMVNTSGELEVMQDTDEPYTVYLTLPDNEEEQLRGHLEISAWDAAGNESALFQDGGEFVVDTIPPERTVSCGLKDEVEICEPDGKKHYYSGQVYFVFHITEANFFEDDVTITVSKDDGTDWEPTVEWQSAGEDHVAMLPLEDDGEYVVSMTYTDRSGNEMLPYTSDAIVVDTTKPVIEFQYDDYSGEKPQTATITVTERNFCPDDVVVEVTEAKTITGKDVPQKEELQKELQKILREEDQWKQEGDVHTAYLSEQFADAIYVLTFNYNDLAKNPAAEVSTKPFTVDHTAPKKMSVNYTGLIKDTDLSTVTLGFYNPTVTVTFTAYDDTAGVDYFIWSYMRQEGASTENVELYENMWIAAEQDPEENNKFTASITLQGDQAQQLRGTIAFTATDKYGNVSDTLTDSGHVLVVDTISPVITAEYTSTDNIYENKPCYNKALTATFTITEANFFSEDVIVLLTKDNKDTVRVEPDWTDISADEHVGTYVFEVPDDHSKDGEYVFTVTYTDRSKNIMEEHTFVFVVDTTPPKQDVSFGLHGEGNSQTVGNRHYFSGPVDFVLRITETNFVADEVTITVEMEDGTIWEPDVPWKLTDVEDVQTAVLPLEEDGAYTVKMTYTDCCGYEMPSYTSETIVVDHTKPVIEFHYDDYSGEKPQTATITVTEHNFCPDDMVVEVTEAKTVTGKDVPQKEELQKELQKILREEGRWEKEGDVYTAYLSDQFADAIYVLTFHYKDLAKNPAAEVRTDPFIVDHTAPSTADMSISYSASVKDTILSAITFGFYNPAVTVTFTAYDDKAGVDYFTWSYMRQEGVSVENVERYEDTRIAAEPDPADKTKFTASVTLSGGQAQQLRGMIAFTATDNYGNVSDKLTDSGNVLVVDTISPVIAAEYTLPDNTYGSKMYYNKALTATFTVTEANFFSEDVVVLLTKDKEAPVRVEPVWTDVTADVHVGTYVLEAPDSHAGDGDYVFTVSYTDRSNNTMEVHTSGVLVVDTTSPKQSVSFGLSEGGSYQPVGTRHYFSGLVDFVFRITETNFIEEDVHITVSKDGGAAREQTVTWKPTDVEDVYESVLTLTEDGDYVVSMTYTDRCGYEMPPYTSETIVVDATEPEIGFSYADYSGENPQMATITIEEHNFRQSDIVVATEAKTITDLDVAAEDLQSYLRSCRWVHEGDVHTAYLSDQFVDAIYVLTCDYDDLALNPAAEVRTERFVVDHTPPSTDSMSVSYSTPVKDTILSAITFGFYNPVVTVTFTAYDDTAGVDYFTWGYMRQEGVSTENVELYADTRIAAVQDPADKAKFSASITLPGEQAQQLRGMIAFTATDKYGNVSDKLTDSGHVLVVDTISPLITAEYTPPDNTFGGKQYYNKALTATFTVTEANFFSEDVVVMLTKDDEAPVQIEPVWTDISADVHVGTYVIEAPNNHAGDGDYVFTVNYTDRSDNTMGVYTSDIFVIDTILPVIEIEYSDENPVNTLADGQGIMRKYFPTELSATLTITEHNFNPEEIEIIITAADVAGNALNAEALYRITGWTSKEDINTATIVYQGDANYSFDIEYIDLALHEMPDYATEYFTVDKSMPETPEVSYSTSVLDTILANISFGFYNAQMTVTVTALDTISGVYGFDYGYLKAEGVSAVNAELEEQLIEEAQISFSEGGAMATASFQISQAALAAGNQFNGTVRVSATDRAGNQSDNLRDDKRIVVDNIAPTATVEYNVPVQLVDNISYYDGDINATITVNEANFYSEDVTVSVTRDGASYAVTPLWNDNSTDVHTGTFTLTGDGDYFVEITYSDKSGNVMQQYRSEQMTIDTQIEEAVITVNGMDADGKAFKDEVVLAVSFEDTNFEDYEILLTRTSYANKNMDVTQQFIGGGIITNTFGGSGSFDTFSRIAENDGIYTVTVNLSDRAGHTVSKTATFTVNRYGSVYEYSDYLVDLIRDGGAYVQKVEEDLLITEYNADRLVSQSLNIEISRDGKPLDSYDYRVTPDINDVAITGDKGWYQYQYTILKENFSADGVYKISVSSIDQTGNTPENTNYDDKAILFRVDSTVPEINSITGLENAIVNATSLEIKYTVYDTIGLASVAVYVDGEEKEDITDFAGDAQNYLGNLLLAENPQARKVRLVVRDLAGNVTDTDAENFISAFAFSSIVTISTNVIVRWYANKLLFWGSIGGTVALVGTGTGGVILFVRRRRKRQRANA